LYVGCAIYDVCSRPFSGWDIHDTTYSRELLVSNRANGYKDVVATIDLSTYRRLSWEGNTPFFLVSFLDPDTREPICADPRGTLKKAMDRAGKHGWEAVAGVEYEACCYRHPSTRP
jgi:glutamine synthetase